MSRGAEVRIIRTTQSALDDHAANSDLYEGEQYLVTDRRTVAVGTAVDAYFNLLRGEGAVAVRVLTQAQYAALSAPDELTLYFIVS